MELHGFAATRIVRSQREEPQFGIVRSQRGGPQFGNLVGPLLFPQKQSLYRHENSEPLRRNDRDLYSIRNKGTEAQKPQRLLLFEHLNTVSRSQVSADQKIRKKSIKNYVSIKEESLRKERPSIPELMRRLKEEEEEARKKELELVNRRKGGMNQYDEYYLCLCGTHVHQGVFLIALFGCIQWGLSAFPMVAASIAIKEYSGIFVAVASGISPWCLLVGNRQGIPCCYWPHLVINGMMLVFTMLMAVVMFFFGVTALIVGLPETLRANEYFEEDQAMTLLFVIIISLLCLGIGLVEYYLLRVVYRGYRYLNEEITVQENPDPAIRLL
ncbi:unnamed protein product [Bursaphelenchus xylophilus]|uniref:(pine wood nematode) hypothetical protein n=1 Tax=Bursaphelenchus xylophilus TaxID=6326 RepID=A0A1I7RLU3_BURXY|nr:unnamed protein product [Bursaphelenchus xylophilus]CAG9106242.1 unnamed protein product [Bursaphelenchus xylophilus]